MQEKRLTTQQQIDDMRRELALEKERLAGNQHRQGDELRKARKKVAASVLGHLVFICIAAFLCYTIVAVYQAKKRGEVPSLPGGFQLFVVESGSMEPTLPVGSVILNRRPQNAAALQERDIITFRTSSGAIVTHRILEVIHREDNLVLYRTKGDNPQNSPDTELLEPQRILSAFVAKVPFT